MAAGCDMSMEEFLAYCAENSGMSTERMFEFGFYVEPCDCGAESCLGWAWNWSVSRMTPETRIQVLEGKLQERGEP
jgi:hypothetical protein